MVGEAIESLAAIPHMTSGAMTARFWHSGAIVAIESFGVISVLCVINIDFMSHDHMLHKIVPRFGNRNRLMLKTYESHFASLVFFCVQN